MANMSSVYDTALGRWLGDQAASSATFREARDPLTEAAAMFAPGGTYGAGQRMQVETGAKRSLADINLAGVKSGMSSGSLAAGGKARVGQERTQAFLNIDDKRMNFLTQILQQLSSLIGTEAQTKAGAADPFASSYMASQDPRTDLNRELWLSYQLRRKGGGSAVFTPV